LGEAAPVVLGIDAPAELTAGILSICQHFKDDIDYCKLCQSFVDLLIIMDNDPASCVQDIVDKVVELGPAKRLHAHLVRLLLLTVYRIMPVTPVTAERSFSILHEESKRICDQQRHKSG